MVQLDEKKLRMWNLGVGLFQLVTGIILFIITGAHCNRQAWSPAPVPACSSAPNILTCNLIVIVCSAQSAVVLGVAHGLRCVHNAAATCLRFAGSRELACTFWTSASSDVTIFLMCRL